MYMGTYSVTLPNAKPPVLQKAPDAEINKQIQPPPVVSYQNDSFIKSNKGKIAAGIGLVAALGAGAYALMRCGRFDKIKAEIMHKGQERLANRAVNIQAEADEIYPKASKAVYEIASYIKDGMNNGYKSASNEAGKLARKFTGDLSELSESVFLEEFDSVGNLVRRTNFNPSYYGKIHYIDEFTGSVVNRTDNIISNEEGTITGLRYLNGFKTSKEGFERASKIFNIENDRLIRYMEKEKEADKIIKYKRVFEFGEDKKLSKVMTNFSTYFRPIKTGITYDPNGNIIMTGHDAKNGAAKAIYSFYDGTGKIEGAAAKITTDENGRSHVLGRLFEYDESGKAVRRLWRPDSFIVEE